MSKKQQQKTEKPVSEAVEPPKPTRSVPKHLQCPICFEGRGGTGVEKWWQRVSGTMVRRCYRCNECAHCWTATVRTVTQVLSIEHQEVQIAHHEPKLDTR